MGNPLLLEDVLIRIAIETIQSADFLTDEEERDIFYYNAVRFLRLDTEGRSHK